MIAPFTSAKASTSHLIGSGLIGAATAALAAWYNQSGPLFQNLLIATGVLFWMDLALGLLVARVIRNEKITSVKLRRVPLKSIQYFALILFAYLLDGIFTQVGGQTAHVYVIEIGALASIVIHEGTSVLEHLKALEPLTGFRIPDWVSDKVGDLEDALGTDGDQGEEPANAAG